MTSIQTPAARNTDPRTSHMAAEAMTKSGKRQSNIEKCFKAVLDNPGSSSAKIAKVTGLDRHEAARRLADLKGLRVKQGAPEYCDVCKRECVTWWAV